MIKSFLRNSPVLSAAALAALTSLPAPKAEAGTAPYLGEVMLVGFNYCPRGWIDAAGQRMAIQDHQALFALFGTMYGGDERTYFNLPDLRGRVPVSAGQGPGLSDRRMGERFGTETNKRPGGTPEPRGTQAPDQNDAAAPAPDATRRPPISNMQPTLVMRYCIAIMGTFPPRN